MTVPETPEHQAADVWLPPLPDENRFESDHEAVLDERDAALPERWQVGTATAEDLDDLVALLRRHEAAARGWASADADSVGVEISEPGSRTRENVLVRDADGRLRGWGSVHDRAAGRMMLILVVDPQLADSSPEDADAVADLLDEWAQAQAREVGRARGLDVQQIDTGAFADHAFHQHLLSSRGYEQVRTWWQMSRATREGDAELVEDPEDWERDGLRVRAVRRQADGLPDEDDVRTVHDVLEAAFADHFNSYEESFDEFVFRLREDPGHRWDHWWVAELTDEVPRGGDPVPAGALVGTVSHGEDGAPDGSYVAYIGVLDVARGRGVGTGLLHTIIADAARRGRDRVRLEVDADSPTGAQGLYTSLGWETKYVTQSWHKDVPTDA